MKIAITIARILLGLTFVFFGSNAFLHFLPTPPMPPTPAGQFLNSLIESRYVLVIGAAQVVGGLLLLINRYVPLALAILGPVIVNIISYHVFMSMAGVPLAILVTILWGFLFYSYRQHFSSLFFQRAAPN